MDIPFNRYIFVPKFVSREHELNTQDPTLIENPNLMKFKEIADGRHEYSLNQIGQLPDVDSNVLPDRNLNDDTYRLYKPEMP